jgi:hypothetical protein
MANEFKVRKSLVVNGSGSVLLDVQGSQGQLFSITDSLSGSLFSVKDISGMPVMEAFSDNTVRMGQFGSKALFVSQSRVGIGKEAPLNALLDISGSATVTGSFSVNGLTNIAGVLSGSFTANNPSSSLIVLSGSITPSASLGGASAMYVNTVLSASANSQVLVGLDINPTFTNGAFTGVTQRFASFSIAGSNKGAIKWDNTNSILELNSTGRLDLTAGSGYQIFFNAISAIFQSSLNVNRTGFASSTATQAGSYPLVFQSSLWDGTSQAFFYNSFKSLASTTVNQLSRFSLFANTTSTGGGGTEYLSLFNNTGNFTLQNGGTFTDNGYRLQVQPGVSGSLYVSGSSSFTGSVNVLGDITSTGTITAQQLIVQTISSSISYASGSNRFGSLLTDTQSMTGSVGITGSLNVSGSTSFSGSVNIVSGSLTVASASLAVSGSLSINGVNITATGGFQQTFTAATTWTATHNLNTLYPVITVYNGSGQVIQPSSITSTSANVTTLTFNVAVAGTVNIISGQLQQNIAVSNPTAVALSTVLGG